MLASERLSMMRPSCSVIAEGAAAEAAAHDVDRKADHFPRGNFRLSVARVRRTGVGQAINVIHLGGAERNRRRVEPEVAVAVLLHQRAGVAGIRFEVELARGFGIGNLVGLHRVVVRQAHVGHRTVVMRLTGAGFVPVRSRRPTGRHHERAATQVADRVDRRPLGEPVRELDQRTLGVAEQQQVGLAVDQHGTLDGFRPVVEMRDAAQRSLDAADDDGHILECFARALGIDGDGVIGAPAGFGVGGVGIVRADFLVGRVTVNHRIHVAGGDAEEQFRLAEPAEVGGGFPVRLRDDADAKSLRLQQPADQRHAEARVVDVGIAGDEDDVAGVPAARIHFAARHRQEGGNAEALRPIGAVAGQGAGWGRISHGGESWHVFPRTSRFYGHAAGYNADAEQILLQ